jgi:hypothetical protein
VIFVPDSVWQTPLICRRVYSLLASSHVDPENPTLTGLVMDVPDLDAVMAAMETEAAADAMAYDVLPETLVILIEA